METRFEKMQNLRCLPSESQRLRWKNRGPDRGAYFLDRHRSRKRKYGLETL